MRHPDNGDHEEESDTARQRRLVFDGTANLDDADEEPVPRVRGLIELLNLYFARNTKKPR